MIFIDMNIYENGRTLDLLVDENIEVEELINEICSMVDIRYDTWIAISKVGKCILERTKTLKKSGIKGGDTLILIGG